MAVPGMLRKLRRELGELHQGMRDRRNNVDAARKAAEGLENCDKAALFAAWKADYRAYKVSFREYYDQYRFPARSPEEKADYMSTISMFALYRRYVDPESRAVLRDKARFLKAYAQFIHRKWTVWTPGEDTAKALELAAACDIVAKPLTGTHGEGVRKCPAGTLDDAGLAALTKGAPLLLEECVRGHAELEAFHPQSLNTIRLTCFSDGKCVLPMWSVMRFGTGAGCVDNTHGGGLSALVDWKTGRIISDGQRSGEILAVHPDTGLKFRDFQIPCWDRVLETCRQATLHLPRTYFAGWDVAVLEDGSVELIEGNHGPDVDGVQTLLGHGIKPEILQALQELSIIK